MWTRSLNYASFCHHVLLLDLTLIGFTSIFFWIDIDFKPNEYTLMSKGKVGNDASFVVKIDADISHLLDTLLNWFHQTIRKFPWMSKAESHKRVFVQFDLRKRLGRCIRPCMPSLLVLIRGPRILAYGFSDVSFWKEFLCAVDCLINKSEPFHFNINFVVNFFRKPLYRSLGRGLSPIRQKRNRTLSRRSSPPSTLYHIDNHIACCKF